MHQQTPTSQFEARNTDTELFAYYATGMSGGTLGDLKTMTDPLGNVTTYTYFSNGLIAGVKDARNNTTSFTYNWRGEMLTKTNPLRPPRFFEDCFESPSICESCG
jgi:YD repeat-containing protein